MRQLCKIRISSSELHVLEDRNCKRKSLKVISHAAPSDHSHNPPGRLRIKHLRQHDRRKRRKQRPETFPDLLVLPECHNRRIGIRPHRPPDHFQQENKERQEADRSTGKRERGIRSPGQEDPEEEVISSPRF